MKHIIDLLTTYAKKINRSAIFGVITYSLSFVYIFWIKPGDSVTFGLIFAGACTMLGLAIKEDGQGPGPTVGA